MKRPLILLAALAASSAAHADDAPPAFPSIELRHGSETERKTKVQLESLLVRYDLRPWSFTQTVMIDDDAIPHSHPLLTLHTRHLRDDDLLLSTYIHEQSHHYFAQHESQTDAAVLELKKQFSTLPVGFPDGADSIRSSYEHLLVIAFEQDGLRRLLGEMRAHVIMQFWADDHYRALYRLMLDRVQAQKVWSVLRANGLKPPVATSTR
jgi:hypothetical protein